jgi:hypothetical protein
MTRPKVTAQFGRHFEDHELVGPRRKAALTSKLVDPAGNEQHRVGSSLMSQIIHLRTGDLSACVAASDLATGDP